MPTRTAAASGFHARVSIVRRTITNPSGTASIAIVNGRARMPQASAAATQTRNLVRSVSRQRTVAHTATSHVAVLVVSEKYEADQWSVTQAVVHHHHVRRAIHSLASLRPSQNTSIAGRPASTRGIRPGRPRQRPGHG